MSDLTITPGDVQAGVGNKRKRGSAGEDVDAGELAYQNSTDAEYYLADNNDTEAKADVAGVLLNSGADGQPVELQYDGLLTVSSGVTVGEVYVASLNPGKIMPVGDLVSGQYVTVIGIGHSATEIKLGIIVSGKQVP